MIIQTDPQPAGAVILCQRLVKIYRVGSTDVPALAGLDLSVDHGEMVGVIGPSGCGKSTLLNIIGALISPTSGVVVVDGQDLAAMSQTELDRFRRERVGFVWQDTARNLLPYLDARANVALPLRLVGTDHASYRAQQLLELVGLGDRALHVPSRLSGGQQQRAAIAVALANSPSLLLADEPTGSLDGETSQEIYQTLREVNRELGLTVFIVSHDPNMASVVDRVVELRDGQSAMEHRGQGEFDDGSVVLLVDTLGRIRVPDEFRESLGIGDRVEARIEEGKITLIPVDAPRREARRDFRD
ncbi:MAG: ATP-binding cassette domain-containing protein [Acidimicrobiia bacterium]